MSSKFPEKGPPAHRQTSFHFIDANSASGEDKLEKRRKIRSHAGRWSWQQPRSRNERVPSDKMNEGEDEDFGRFFSTGTDSEPHLVRSPTIPPSYLSSRRLSRSQEEVPSTKILNSKRDRFNLSNAAVPGSGQGGLIKSANIGWTLSPVEYLDSSVLDPFVSSLHSSLSPVIINESNKYCEFHFSDKGFSR
jgi:hypothetical protein